MKLQGNSQPLLVHYPLSNSREAAPQLFRVLATERNYVYALVHFLKQYAP